MINCKSFVSLHSTSFLNPQEYNLCGDGPEGLNVLEHHDNSSPSVFPQSSRVKQDADKLLYFSVISLREKIVQGDDVLLHAQSVLDDARRIQLDSRPSTSYSF